MGFNKRLFSELLLRAKGDTRSINQYARESGVTAAHISRLSRQINDSPPAPQTLQKLARVAKNGVGYEDFMTAAGHTKTDLNIAESDMDTFLTDLLNASPEKQRAIQNIWEQIKNL